MNKISGFFGEYRWLSNFWFASVTIDGIKFPSAEHAYQALKFPKSEWPMFLNQQTPAQAKRLAAYLNSKRPYEETWNQQRLNGMEVVVRLKFTQNPALAYKLKNTASSELIEENNWHDTFWGVCKGIGENHLGKILMNIRSELQRKKI